MTTKPMTRAEYVRYAKELLRNPLMNQVESVYVDMNGRVELCDTDECVDFLGRIQIDFDNKDSLVTREELGE